MQCWFLWLVIICQGSSNRQARYVLDRCLMLWSSNDVTHEGSRPKTRLGLPRKSIMNIATKAVVATVLVVGLADIAGAACKKSHVCDDYGNNCRVQDICDSKLDLPSIELAPLRPLPSMELKPLPSMELPPLGTSQCQYVQVNGVWQNVCR